MFPVLNTEKSLVGSITRHTLQVVLQNLGQINSVGYEELVDSDPSELLQRCTAERCAEEGGEEVVDLGPFVNGSPVSVPLTFSLHRYLYS